MCCSSTNQVPFIDDQPSSGGSVEKPLLAGMKDVFEKAKQRLSKFQQFGNLANIDDFQHQPVREEIHSYT